MDGYGELLEYGQVGELFDSRSLNWGVVVDMRTRVMGVSGARQGFIGQHATVGDVQRSLRASKGHPRAKCSV